jgi:hypothetical protein
MGDTHTSCECCGVRSVSGTGDRIWMRHPQTPFAVEEKELPIAIYYKT